MTKDRISILTMAGTYIGTVVGAGFASGQEVLQFFGLFGAWGTFGVIAAVGGFFVFGFTCIEIGRQVRATSYKPVLTKAVGKTISQVLDFVTIFFLFGGLSAMISGAGSAIAQEFGIPWIVGALAMALMTFITVLTGFKGITYAIGSVVPFLLAGVFLIAASTILVNGLHIGIPPPGYHPPISHWAVSAFNYICYNLFMAAPVLSAVGGSLKNGKESFQIAFWGALGLGLGLLLVHLSVVSSLPDIARYEIPLARLATQTWRFGKYLYITIFFAEVYTTAVANLYGFVTRLSSPKSRTFFYISLFVTAASLCAASAGFSNLIRVIYPLCGWAGAVFIAGLTINLAERLFKKL